MKKAEVVSVSKPPYAEQEALLTVDERARPVEDRLGTPDVARTVYQRYRQALLTVAKADARVMTLHRGAAPYDDAELRGLLTARRNAVNRNRHGRCGRIDRRAAQARGKGAHAGNRQRRAAERGHEARHWGAPFGFFVCGE